MTRPMTPASLTPPEQALDALFAARAQRMPEDTLEVAAVLARATTLRRRRTAYRSSVALVAVLAVIPLGTDLAHRWSGSPQRAASESVTGTGSPTIAPGPRSAWASTLDGGGASRRVDLTLTGLPRGADLAVPYVTDPTAWRIVPATGASIALPAAQGRYGAPARVHGGWLVPNYRADEQSSELVRVADDGQILGRSISRAVGVSTDRRTVAYTWDGRLVRESVLDGSRATADFPAGQVSDLAVLDDGTVYLHDQAGGTVTEYRWRVGESVAPWPGHGYLRGAWGGNTLLRDTTDVVPCSSLLVTAGETSRLRSCARVIRTLSPDGRYAWVSGRIANGYESGAGGIADLVTGQMVLDLVTAADAAPQIVGQVWEDPTHLLLVTTENARWTVLRLAVDGHLELATDVVSGGDTTQFDLGRPGPGAL